MLEECKPDIILVTGDLLDSRRINIEVGNSFCEKAVKIAQTYYVTGNHEARIAEYEDTYTVLLAHRPELFETYVECRADLVFRGHSHGGQLRLHLVQL